STSPCTQRSITPGVVTASRNLQHSAHCPDRMDGLIRFHELEERFEGAPSVANQAVTYERISRSSLSLRFSRRNRESSSRSVLVSPPSPLPASRSSCLTQSEIDQDVGPNSFAKDAGVRPERTRSTICRRRVGPD